MKHEEGCSCAKCEKGEKPKDEMGHSKKFLETALHEKEHKGKKKEGKKKRGSKR